MNFVVFSKCCSYAAVFLHVCFCFSFYMYAHVRSCEKQISNKIRKLSWQVANALDGILFKAHAMCLLWTLRTCTLYTTDHKVCPGCWDRGNTFLQRLLFSTNQHTGIPMKQEQWEHWHIGIIVHQSITDTFFLWKGTYLVAIVATTVSYVLYLCNRVRL